MGIAERFPVLKYFDLLEHFKVKASRRLAMRNRMILSLFFVLSQLFLIGCGENDTSPIMPPMLVVQVSSATCATKVDDFVITVEGYGSTAIAGPGNTVSFGVGTGN